MTRSGTISLEKQFRAEKTLLKTYTSKYPITSEIFLAKLSFCGKKKHIIGTLIIESMMKIVTEFAGFYFLLTDDSPSNSPWS